MVTRCLLESLARENLSEQKQTSAQTVLTELLGPAYLLLAPPSSSPRPRRQQHRTPFASFYTPGAQHASSSALTPCGPKVAGGLLSLSPPVLSDVEACV